MLCCLGARAGQRFAREWLVTIFVPLNVMPQPKRERIKLHSPGKASPWRIRSRRRRLHSTAATHTTKRRATMPLTTVLGWLLAGTAALALSNLHDKELVARVLEPKSGSSDRIRRTGRQIQVPKGLDFGASPEK